MHACIRSRWMAFSGFVLGLGGILIPLLLLTF